MDSRGLTVPELLTFLVVVGVAVHATLMPARRQLDGVQVRAAREEVVALFHRARAGARLRGEARVRVADGANPELLVSGHGAERVMLDGRGVELEVLGSRSETEFVFGPLGIAHLASATLVLRRGDAEVRLIVSGYGRVRR
jgi:Tfp pilus assembly protein FimT